MGNRRRLAGRLAELLKQYDKQIAQAFLQSVQGKASSVNLAELVRAIEANDINRAATIAGITKADLFPVDLATTSAYIAGGQTVSAAAPRFAANFGFDGRAVRAENWARTHVGSLVTNIVDEQLDMLRETIGQQLSAGIGPRKIAVQIAGLVVGTNRQGGFIGLTKEQAGYVNGRFREDGTFVRGARQQLAELDSAYFSRKLRDRRFDGIVRKAIADGKPLAQADIDRIAARYSDRMLKHRADTIARTESITALRAGRHEGVLQGVEAGAIRRNSVKRRWDATLDRRTRPDHAAMHGQEVEGLETPFVLPDGSRMVYPGSTELGASASQTVNCRCYSEMIVDWLRG